MVKKHHYDKTSTTQHSMLQTKVQSSSTVQLPRFHSKIQNGEYYCIRVRVRVFNATFNTVSVILWQSVLLVEETGVP